MRESYSENAAELGTNNAPVCRLKDLGFRPPPLTPREGEVLELLAQRPKNGDLGEYLLGKEIAKQLGISHATVRKHVQNLIRKFKVRRQDDLPFASRQLDWEVRDRRRAEPERRQRRSTRRSGE